MQRSTAMTVSSTPPILIRVVYQVVDAVGISIGSCHQIFTEKLQMRRVSAKFVTRLFTVDQKENRVEISKKLLANANGNENFLNIIITCNLFLFG